jgi:hypothetical protein
MRVTSTISNKMIELKSFNYSLTKSLRLKLLEELKLKSPLRIEICKQANFNSQQCKNLFVKIQINQLIWSKILGAANKLSRLLIEKIRRRNLVRMISTTTNKWISLKKYKLMKLLRLIILGGSMYKTLLLIQLWKRTNFNSQ